MRESIARIGWAWTIALLLPFAIFTLSGAQEAAEEMAPVQYVGAKKCSICHKSAKQGRQFWIWQQSKHAMAWVTLVNPEAKALAAKLGIEDPQRSEKCLRCHTTAYGVPGIQKATTLKAEDGVGCEACHGPGSRYKTAKIMEDRALAIRNGLIVPDENVCRRCHNKQSPTYKKFVYSEFVKEIAHPVPKD